MARHTDWRTLDNIAARLNAAQTRDVELVDFLLDGVNAQLALYGVESVTYPCDVYPSVLYVNTGDSYTATICYDVDSGTFVAASWGDMLEEHDNTCEDCQATWDEDEGTDGEDE